MFLASTLVVVVVATGAVDDLSGHRSLSSVAIASTQFVGTHAKCNVLMLLPSVLFLGLLVGRPSVRKLAKPSLQPALQSEVKP